MFKAFNLSQVKQDAVNKEIHLVFNFDVDKDSIEADTFSIVSVEGAHIDFTYDVVDEVVYIKLKEWPAPNAVYYITIKATVQSISGQQLKNALRYNLTFESHITSLVTIKSPYNFQQIDNLEFELEDTENINVYYVEIAKENRFYNLVYNSVVSKNNVALVISDMQPGQYYIRARVVESGEYGKWSNVITFIYKNICDCEEPKEDGPAADASMPSAWSDLFGDGSQFVNGNTSIPDSVKPEIEDELEVITMPEQGETPASFIFEVDKELDPDFGEVIIIKREF